jgi:predicted CoA-binding protein
MATLDFDPVILQAVFPPPRRIAILGASDHSGRPSNGVAGALLNWGYTIYPVNPNCRAVHGLKTYGSLSDIEGPLDIVNVFRRSESVAGHLEEILAAAPTVLWMQDGVGDDVVAETAKAAGIMVVSDDCIARRIAQWQSSLT